MLLALAACHRATELPLEKLDGAAPVAVADAAPLAPDSTVPAPDTTAPAPDTAAPAPDTAIAAPRDAGAEAPGRDAPADAPPADCGKLGGSCCPDLTCTAPESVCVGSDAATAVCQKCGRATLAQRLPCCPGNQCLDGSCCIAGVTANLGPACSAPGTVCFELGSLCGAGGSCRPTCGGANQPCCQGLNLSYCSASGTACMQAPGASTATCVPCGQAGQPCCAQLPSDYSIEPCGRGLRCTAAICQP
jgi:hypothetical protein